MQKFLNVDGFLIAINGIVSVAQTAATTTAITYADGLIITLTHASEAAPAAFNDIVAVIGKALAKEWTKPVYAVSSVDSIPAISAIAATHVVVPTA